jgi:hypothetical protein
MLRACIGNFGWVGKGMGWNFSLAAWPGDVGQ